jgi:hypothetical protein
MGRASTPPDRDSGLHLPVLSTNGAYLYLGLGRITHETNGNSWYGLVGFIPRLNSWAFSLSLCNRRTRRIPQRSRLPRYYFRGRTGAGAGRDALYFQSGSRRWPYEPANGPVATTRDREVQGPAPRGRVRPAGDVRPRPVPVGVRSRHSGRPDGLARRPARGSLCGGGRHDADRDGGFRRVRPRGGVGGTPSATGPTPRPGSPTG